MREKSTDRLQGLESHMGYLLRVVSGQVSAAFERTLQSRDISIAEWVALRLLHDHEDISSSDLALLLDMTRGAVSKVLDKLEAKGLAARTTRTEDKRSQAVKLTLAGKHILPQLAKLADTNDAQQFACLDEQEQTQLRKLLQKLAKVHKWKGAPVN